MGIPDRSLSDIIEKVRSWIPWGSDLVSREFWMPDNSCRMCYECDSRFTVFNCRHHCRSCGRVFCSKCMQVTDGSDESDQLKFCKFCFRAIGQEVLAECDGRFNIPLLPPVLEFGRDKLSISRSFQSDRLAQFLEVQPGCSSPLAAASSSTASLGDPLSPISVHCSLTRSYEEDADDAGKHLLSPLSEYCRDISDIDGSNTNIRNEFYNFKGVASSPLGSPSMMTDSPNRADESPQHQQGGSLMSQNDFLLDREAVGVLRRPEMATDDAENPDYCTDDLSIFQNQCQEAQEPLDFENNGLIWFPPPPEDEEDDVEDSFYEDDDDDENIGGTGMMLSSSSFGSDTFPMKERSNEMQKGPLRAVVRGHFRALVSQLLKGEGIYAGNEIGGRGWLEIVASLAWQAANFVKPDTSRGGSMDPGDYVKVKCVASGSPSESTLVKGVVCTKNIKHKRMTSQYKNPKLLLLGGALEYQRVQNQLASIDTLLQQEIEHLKMTVAKIEAHRPNVLLVEKSVSSYAQEYLLAKEISLVLNVKRPLLERIARCTGAHIVPSIENLSSTRLGHCETFRLERVSEECASSDQPNKRSTKTLMFFEGCPRRLACTIVLRGRSRDELKKVKDVIQYAIFAAYHLSLETSFLADEGASLPKIPKSPIAVPDRTMNADSSISVISDQVKPVPCQKIEENNQVIPAICQKMEVEHGNKLGNLYIDSEVSTDNKGSSQNVSESEELHYLKHHNTGPMSPNSPAIVDSGTRMAYFTEACADLLSCGARHLGPSLLPADVGTDAKLAMLENTVEEGKSVNHGQPEETHLQTEVCKVDENDVSSEYFSAAENHQSILVSLSSRCVLKGTVCERSQLFRIKFYGSFDKPLGRFLRDDLFDQRSFCRSCNEPAEAHVRCYTHQHGNLTISVRRLPSLKLSGERDGKIWMWHRCLKCAHKDGVPPATRRVVMSDAAWGLSFGKFLELSFSNHATANRVANCGHSLQKDCLRYYGFGCMVAFFRYSPIDILSVNLPPSMLEFGSDIQHEWVIREAMEVSNKMESLYTDIFDALQSIEERITSFGCEPSKTSDFLDPINELKDMIRMERDEYDGLLQPINIESQQPGHATAFDILELNRLRRCLLIDSYMWDRRLYLLDSCLKTKTLNFRSDPSLLENWRSESFHKDGRFGCTHEENDMKSLTLLDNPRDLILSKQREELNIQLMEATSNEIVKANLSTETVKGYIGPERTELTTAYPQKLDEGHLNVEDPVENISSEKILSPVSSLSDRIDLAWIGSGQSENAQLLHGPQPNRHEGSLLGPTNTVCYRRMRVNSFDSALRFQDKLRRGLSPAVHLSGAKSFHASGDFDSLVRDPFPSMLRPNSVTSPRATQKLNFIFGYTPLFISSTSRMLSDGVHLLLPQTGRNNITIAVYDNEPASIISYALNSKEYEDCIADKLNEHQFWNENDSTREDDLSNILSYRAAVSTSSVWHSFSSLDSDDFHSRSFGSDEVSSSRGSLFSDAKRSHHVRVSFGDESSPSSGKVKFAVTCYFAKQFDALRKKCCPSEVSFVRSLSRCRRWSAQGGKSNVYFAKTLDERFIIKQVTKTELESFEEFAPEYFKYLMDSLRSGSPTCLAKILGIYQVTVKHLKGGKEMKMDLMVMENLFFGRNISRVYDLKGSARARYNPDASGSNKVLLDLNLLETLRTKPIFLGSKAKRSLERAIWNDTSFLASIDVMDYSLLVGLDEQRKELVLGIIDYMRQYTWDKHLETWVKASGILGGPKNAPPTVVSPKQYKKRFRKAMSTYFLTVPDQWSS